MPKKISLPRPLFRGGRKKMTKGLNRVTVSLSDSHFNYLENQMELTNMTRTSLIQLAIESYINQSEQLQAITGLVAEAQKIREEAEKVQ